MSFLKKLFGKSKSTDSYSFKLERAKELHGQPVKYVTEHRNGNEDVRGRGGALCLKGDEFIVDSSGDRLFVTDVSELEARGIDLEQVYLDTIYADEDAPLVSINGDDILGIDAEQTPAVNAGVEAV